MNASSLRLIQPRRRFGCIDWFRALVAAWLACALFTGCTSMHPVPRSDFTQIAERVKPGDHVRCTLRDGNEFAFTVTQVETGALVGKKHRIAIADVARLEVRRFSAGKTLWLVAGLVAAGVMVEGIASMGSLGFPATAP